MTTQKTCSTSKECYISINDAQTIAEWQMATLTKRYYVLRPLRRARGQNEGIFKMSLFCPLQLLTFTNISRPWLMVSNQALLFSEINLKFKSLSMSLSQASSFQTNQAAGTLLIKLVQPGDLRSKKDPCCFSPFAMMISIWAARILALSAQCNSWNFNSLLINQGITFS